MNIIDIDHLNQVADLPSLSQWVSGCTACALHKEATQPIHHSGSYTSPVMLVGMAPAFCEDATGIPFCGREELAESRCTSCVEYTTCFDWQTGLGSSSKRRTKCIGYTPTLPGIPRAVPPKTVKAGAYSMNGLISAGQLLDDLLLKLKIDRKKIFVTNIALCKPEIGDPKPEFINRCSSIRQRTEELLAPKVVIAMGALAIEQYAHKVVKLSSSHGKPIQMPNFVVIPTYHPAYILRKMLSTSSGMTQSSLDKTQADITKTKQAMVEDYKLALSYLSPTELASIEIS